MRHVPFVATPRGPAALSLALLCASACHTADRTQGEIPAPSASSAVPAPVAAVVDAGLPARCQVVHEGAAPDLSFGDGAELGEAIPIASGYAFGAVRGGDIGHVAAVLRVTTSAQAVDIGPSWKEVPAPQPVVRGGDLFAVAYAKARAPGSPSPTGHLGAASSRRSLTIYKITDTAEKLVELPSEADVASEYDVAAAPLDAPIGALVSWDDTLQSPARGVLQLASLAPDLRSVRSLRVVAPISDPGASPADAATPRLVSRPGGYWLAWLARRPEHVGPTLPLPAGEIETPSEEAMFSWVEAVALDRDGAQVGAPRRLTSLTGHAGSFALASEGGAALVVVEDDVSPGHGGGALDEVMWHGDDVPDVRHLVRGGVDEEAPPSIVESGAPGTFWVTFLDVHGDTQLIPLPAAKGPVPSQATREPLLEGGRMLPGRDGESRVATLSGGGWTLRRMRCVR